MDSLDAQCLLIDVAMGEIPPPDLWRHDRSGALACCYEGGTRTFTWPPEDVAEMARRWRDRDRDRTPKQALALRDAHERLAALIAEAELGPADVVIHDLGRAELRAIWEHEKVVLVVERIGDPVPSQAQSADRNQLNAAGIAPS
jgi:hypothetical protein